MFTQYLQVSKIAPIQESSRARAKPGATGTAAPTKRRVRATNGSIASIKTTREGEDISAPHLLLYICDLTNMHALGGEEFRAALQSASTCIKELEALSRSSIPQPATSPSSKANVPHSSSVEVNAQRVEVLGKLIEILRRQLRVKYELNFNEILHA